MVLFLIGNVFRSECSNIKPRGSVNRWQRCVYPDLSNADEIVITE